MSSTISVKDIDPTANLKLGLMKQFTCALQLPVEKVKAGIFNGPQIRKLIKDTEFQNSMNTLECAAWKSFVQVVNNFLGNTKAANHARLISTMIEAFQKLKFPENLGAMSDEQGERFHQDMRQIEESHDGGLLLALKRDNTAAAHTRESKKRRFMP
ncbi:Uncharacterized protein FKW44_006903 [Caligus rogercresseyi]|uniref:Uncharacterized protein n=1 Tax=Caligus rogercresseyi TaxID=217165 RepID=A0A7T8KDY8_CALRO|nr:Uncharacterized protein FKW44_006903 [Caligus rogercresseyi]